MTSKYAILGTFVHRAVAMPFGKPKALNTGETWQDMGARINSAAAFLTDCLSEDDSTFSPLRLVTDPGGPWWTLAANQFFELGASEQQWVAERLTPAARKASEELVDVANEDNWTWLWSEPALLAGAGRRHPRVTRPDLVAGRAGRGAVIIDLKVSVRTDGFTSSFDEWQILLERSGIEVDERWYFAISPYPDGDAQWIPVN